MSARDDVEAALARIADPAGEGASAFTRVYEEPARAAAVARDREAALGLAPLSPLAGAVVSIKDLFDVRGETTMAGSRILAGQPAAAADAPVVRRLRRAGAVIVGKTNMTEFAYSGVGLNPHYGTPGNPHDRRRIPGGSSSGAAVAVADGLCRVAIGTDTGGSTRIPAALCGLVGWKPTAARVPRAGAFPLSYTLDSIGPIARTVGDCVLADRILSGCETLPSPRPVAGLRLQVPRPFLEDLDGEVASAFDAVCRRLRDAGAHIETVAPPVLDAIAALGAAGGLVAAESAAIHKGLFERGAVAYDPRVHARIARGYAISAPDYVGLLRLRERIVEEASLALAGIDAWLSPTTAIVAPLIAALADDDAFTRANALLLRNTSAINLIDGCAISLPAPVRGGLPVGVMLSGPRGGDDRLFGVALGVEALLATPPQ